MRKYLLLVGWAFFALAAPVAEAAGTSTMVLSVAGDVVVENFGKASRLQPFSRLLDGDRVKLGSDGKLTVVYVGSGRQESWSGAGVIAAGEEQSTVVAGAPKGEAKQLPKQVAQQMARTPLADSTGKAGMVRMRALATPEAMAALEQKYQELRSQAAPDDRSPEVFLLAGLFEKSAYDRLEEELTRLEKAYPGDQSILALASIYGKAVSDARQAAKH
ncbi:MAG TPA: hypothetical protein VJ576_12365 [Rhodocyclaceae bacterium]|nr:hypothetical protein [Rhodocyclaceae bacterium]